MVFDQKSIFFNNLVKNDWQTPKMVANDRSRWEDVSKLWNFPKSSNISRNMKIFIFRILPLLSTISVISSYKWPKIGGSIFTFLTLSPPPDERYRKNLGFGIFRSWRFQRATRQLLKRSCRRVMTILKSCLPEMYTFSVINGILSVILFSQRDIQREI